MNHASYSDLWERLTTGDESVDIEVKRCGELGSSVLETICAFANEPNRGGGYLLLGVGVAEEVLFPECRYEIVGVSHLDQIQADLATKCREVFNVAVRPVVSVEAINGKSVLIVFIPEAQPQEKPVYIKAKGLAHGAFRRIGSTDQRCTEDDIALFHQLRTHQTFDETTVMGATIEDLDAQAMQEYRRARAQVNPNATELAYADADLLYSLAATTSTAEGPRPTLAGMMLFGKQSSLRRFFPMTRVDYIRVPGREWVPDPERRYQGVEIIGPLLTTIPRVVATILDDVPKAFLLPMNEIHRRDVPLVPQTVIREAVVNALMHRSYRIRQPVQIIRYANRIEIRNPGHSLVPDDRLGEPGSISRNEKIAAVLHEVGLAETKGTGIRAMRDAMEKANLTQPLFESDRHRDAFTVTLLVHHLLGRDDLTWLGQFKSCKLTEDEARALILVREVGAINNAFYRSINHLDTLTASGRLRRLRDLGLLDQKGKAATTYYVPGPKLHRNTLLTKTKAEPVRTKSAALRTELGTLRAELPPALRSELESMGKRVTPQELASVVTRLCRWRSLSLPELSALTGKTASHLRTRVLRRLLDDGYVRYLYPDEPNHPHQKYTAPTEGQ